jgi:hypothetical protein
MLAGAEVAQELPERFSRNDLLVVPLELEQDLEESRTGDRSLMSPATNTCSTVIPIQALPWATFALRTGVSST